MEVSVGWAVRWNVRALRCLQLPLVKPTIINKQHTCTTDHPTPTATFKALADKFDFSRYSSLRDIGGSAGTLACTVAAAHPHLRCITADLPALLPAARKTIRAAGLEGRVSAEAVDFFEDEFGQADVITMSMILHDCEWCGLLCFVCVHVRVWEGVFGAV